MLQYIGVLLIILALFVPIDVVFAQPTSVRSYKVNISYPAPSVSAMVLEIANQKGFFKEEGVEATLVRVPGTPGVQGMLAGEFDFSTNVGSALNASLRGATFKLVMLNESTLFWLYGKPEISSPNMLRGKKIGMSTRGSLTDINLTALLQKYGIDPSKDVLKIVIGDPGTRLAALSIGSTDAAVLSPPATVRARALGLKPVAFFGEEVESIYTGLVTTDKLIKEEPEKVQRTIKASLKGLRYLKGNKPGTVALMGKTLRIDDQLANATYDETVGAFIDSGFRENSYLAKIVTLQSRFAQVANPPPVDRLFDFSFMRNANEQLRDWRVPK
jgi:NitT/TauT family transport system substrate-binding protein